MDGGRIILGDNSADGAIVLWPIRFQCDGVENQQDSPLYRYTHAHTHAYLIIYTVRYDLYWTFQNVTVT